MSTLTLVDDGNHGNHEDDGTIWHIETPMVLTLAKGFELLPRWKKLIVLSWAPTNLDMNSASIRDNSSERENIMFCTLGAGHWIGDTIITK
ncbi:hypothetical protein FOMPIDRAFT_81948 [Fomitopsis schrenkii]|uniref:Uncharacterized protein n=1 Tax=Fomitopsis schrenkii TaxID=2126942 RepID=S8F6F0_FOMSC|nr:hypothetical protein FOMPIDRAFT_81948 [Fomitopsis schrenkii]